MRYWRKNLALVFVYTLVVFMLASVVFFTHAIKEEARFIFVGSPDIIVQRLVAGRQDLMPARYVDTLRTIIGVSEVRGRLWGYYFDRSVAANYTVVVTDSAGRDNGKVIIGQGVARALNAGKGDLITIAGYDGVYRSFEVKGTFSSESELVSADLVEMSEIDFRGLFRIPEGYYTDVSMEVGNPRETVVAANKIRRLLPDTRPILRDEMLRTYDAVFEWRSGILLVIFSGAMLAFFIFAWGKATGLSMEEKREIGILKAVGWDTPEVIALKSWESLIISLSSFLMGIPLAYIHVFFARASLFEPVLKGWAVIYPDFRLVPMIDAYQIMALLFLTVMPYLVATIIPTWLASSIAPDSVMRL